MKKELHRAGILIRWLYVAEQEDCCRATVFLRACCVAKFKSVAIAKVELIFEAGMYFVRLLQRTVDHAFQFADELLDILLRVPFRLRRQLAHWVK